MRKQITVDEKTNEVVERLARIISVSQSCIFSFGINLVCHEINANEDRLFESLLDYSDNYYKVHNKQGGKHASTSSF